MRSVFGFDLVVHGIDVLFVIGFVIAVILGIFLVLAFIAEHVEFVWDIFAGIKEWWEDRRDSSNATK